MRHEVVGSFGSEALKKQSSGAPRQDGIFVGAVSREMERLRMRGQDAERTRVLLLLVLLGSSPCGWIVQTESAPIRTPDFSSCQPASYPGEFKTFSCCPPASKETAKDYKWPQCSAAAGDSSLDFNPLSPAPCGTRVRPAAQCVDASYESKLNNAYELMRALPDDDPRSLVQQANLHCAYCGGSFLQAGSKTAQIDIHYTWLFFPWHRLFLYFHERILQSLLNETTFSLPFWNWDNQQWADSPSFACRQPGNKFPRIYNQPSTSTFDSQRNPSHTGNDAIIDLGYMQAPVNSSEAASVIASNLNIMRQSMISAGATPETFLGTPYRAGDPRPLPNSHNHDGGQGQGEFSGGTLEMGPHVSAHYWVAQDAPPFLDLGAPWLSAHDPIFYAHHANVDRLWEVWKSLGGAQRHDFDDPDWLNTEFLFYDENSQLVRVTIGDALNLQSLGYTYEGVENSWASYKPTSCSSSSAAREQVSNWTHIPRLHAANSTLRGGETFKAIVDRPAREATAGSKLPDEVLVIHGIVSDSAKGARFDVFLNLMEADARTSLSCAEYVGRFSDLPRRVGNERQFTWKISITGTLRYLQVEPYRSVLVAIVPQVTTSDSRFSFRSMEIVLR